ncbi:MAG: hypothetical protein LBF94_02025 [Puniceicoccales bacterium]|jgi:hypothetical protein|nr:hypothetical protein [Puniceicoccales bacterium]
MQKHIQEMREYSEAIRTKISDTGKIAEAAAEKIKEANNAERKKKLEKINKDYAETAGKLHKLASEIDSKAREMAIGKFTNISGVEKFESQLKAFSNRAKICVETVQKIDTDESENTEHVWHYINYQEAQDTDLWWANFTKAKVNNARNAWLGKKPTYF